MQQEYPMSAPQDSGDAVAGQDVYVFKAVAEEERTPSRRSGFYFVDVYCDLRAAQRSLESIVKRITGAQGGTIVWEGPAVDDVSDDEDDSVDGILRSWRTSVPFRTQPGDIIGTDTTDTESESEDEETYKTEGNGVRLMQRGHHHPVTPLLTCTITETPILEELENVTKNLDALLHRKHWMQELCATNGRSGGGTRERVEAGEEGGADGGVRDGHAPPPPHTVEVSRMLAGTPTSPESQSLITAANVAGEKRRHSSSCQGVECDPPTAVTVILNKRAKVDDAGDEWNSVRPQASTAKDAPSPKATAKATVKATAKSKPPTANNSPPSKPTPKVKLKSLKATQEAASPTTPLSRAARRIKFAWSAEEEDALRGGVERYGSGKWVSIANDPEFMEVLFQRTNVDFKDKWRNMVKKRGVTDIKRKMMEEQLEDQQAKIVEEHTQRVAASNKAKIILDSKPESNLKIIAEPESKPKIIAEPESNRKIIAEPESKPKKIAESESKPKKIAEPESKPKIIAAPEPESNARVKEEQVVNQKPEVDQKHGKKRAAGDEVKLHPM